MTIGSRRTALRPLAAIVLIGIAHFDLSASDIDGADPAGAPDPAQPAIREYRREIQSERLDDLVREFGSDKDLPEGFELQALLALSHYPELRDIKIEFLVKDARIPISSRPRPRSVLRNRRRRRYIIVIDTIADASGSPLILANQPFNAQVGILGHELAHTAEYVQQGFARIGRVLPEEEGTGGAYMGPKEILGVMNGMSMYDSLNASAAAR